MMGSGHMALKIRLVDGNTLDAVGALAGSSAVTRSIIWNGGR